MTSTTVIINCTSRCQIRESLFHRLSTQTIPIQLKVIESVHCPSRLIEINQIDSDFIFFLDQDIDLQSDDSLERIQYLLSQQNQPSLMTGLYLSTTHLSYLQKSYNWLTNQWILLEAQPLKEMMSLQNAAGGIWAIKKSNFINLNDWIEPTEWGGEDTRSIRYLREKGVLILHHNFLDVEHSSSNSLLAFTRRAFLQGRARERWNLKTKRSAHALKKQNIYVIYFMPALFYHLLLVHFGSWYEKIKSLMPLSNPHKPPAK